MSLKLCELSISVLFNDLIRVLILFFSHNSAHVGSGSTSKIHPDPTTYQVHDHLTVTTSCCLDHCSLLTAFPVPPHLKSLPNMAASMTLLKWTSGGVTALLETLHCLLLSIVQPQFSQWLAKLYVIWQSPLTQSTSPPLPLNPSTQPGGLFAVCGHTPDPNYCVLLGTLAYSLLARSLYWNGISQWGCSWTF